jgi:formylglycine-generating enzyme required for sulfatase activity
MLLTRSGRSTLSRFTIPGIFAILMVWCLNCSNSTGNDDRPQLAVAPDSLDFGEIGTARSLSIDNVGGGVLEWSIWVPSKEWVAVERTSGTVEKGPVTVEVRIDREMAPAGRQWMALVVNDGTERREVPLIAFISRSIPIVRPERLPFGEDLERMILSLKNTGNLPLVWSISGKSSWIAAVPEEGTIEPSTSREIEIFADRVGLTPGNYSDQLTISYDRDGKNIQIPVDLTVHFNRAPEADAGLDQTVIVGGWMRLDGSASRDADGDSLSYLWIVPEEIDLDDVHAVRPHFWATALGTHRIGLVVADGRVESAPAEVAVQVIETAPGEEITVALQGEEFHLTGVSIDMVWIEPGTFIMGSPAREEGRGYDEEPQHEVTISQGFFLGKYEITQEQWEAVMGNRPWEGKDGAREDPRHPAVFVSWRDLQKFIDRLNEWEGMDLFRLPTEAEWEYACRAGTTTRWSFGDDENHLKEYAWYRANTWDLGEQYAHMVGMKMPNPWGLYDMYGNVWEWTLDWFSAYSADAQVDPAGPNVGSYRVLRGGSFPGFASGVRAADRLRYSPGVRVNTDVGARLLRVRPTEIPLSP